MRDVILTGFMGTGKTTVGRLLAARFGFDFVDTDEEIERRTGRSIAEIFSSDGEAAFRALESQLLAELRDGSGRIIATGGGTLLEPANLKLLDSDQPVICLSCESGALLSRLEGTGHRPLLGSDPGTAITTLLEEREPIYRTFPQIDTTHLSPDDVANEIAAIIGLSEAAHFDIDESRTSTVYFEAGGAARVGQIMAAHDLRGTILVVTDDRVARARIADSVLKSLREAGYSASCHAIPSGERYKSLDTLRELYATCRDLALDRSAIVVGVGGGVIGDMAGMLAATYLRGLRLVLIPTTLLAQVDASIGGKVGVDLDGAKNLVGAFHPASLVLIDPHLLYTLPAPLIRDGMAEVIKIAAVRSGSLLAMLQQLDPCTVIDQPSVIRRAAQEKVHVVQQDPYERGERMLLNFGHTIGHGLEAASRYELSHGEAVSVGIAAEIQFAVSRGWCRAALSQSITGLLTRFGLPISAPGLDVEEVLSYMQQDKKRDGAMLRVAVPTQPGVGKVFDVTPAEIRLAVEDAVGVGP
ncbi:MAG TPA: 3-dehydroquinate synthase [Chloroflexota bacterium]